ncbi:MAG: glycosyltransferase, partial [Actinomycetota bacterium]|nr:glycosyltransferase [Actinomycetota bacterium]
MPRVVIAAGGTAGHVVPALAVADALRSRGAEVDFVGG